MSIYKKSLSDNIISMQMHSPTKSSQFIIPQIEPSHLFLYILISQYILREEKISQCHVFQYHGGLSYDKFLLVKIYNLQFSNNKIVFFIQCER